MLHRGYDVWISDADGRRIPEYNMEVEGAEGKTVACYIPSESGKRFIINWKDHGSPHHTTFRCDLDGKLAGGTTCKPNHSGRRIGLRTTSDKASYSPYQFADLRTTDDETALWAAGSLEKLGIIEVRAVRIHKHKRAVAFKPYPFQGVDAVHERSKKLGAHCVTLGRPVSTGKPHELCQSTPLYPHEGAYATFIFRYRPPALLQAQGIMPPAAPAFGEGSGVGKGKARAHSNDLSNSGPSRVKPEKSRGKDKVKAEPAPASGSGLGLSDQSVQSDVIELFDSDYDYEEVDRKPVIHRSGRARRVKPERVEADPDDVIDLTLDD
ncbi:hypothetical protein TRAPUB_264 [Trametes pubescens]|uniref:DUF7918 domain-containing protein n=1 Tax=Trametes pubescens TaxID=154538 RepID=A0A1M2VMM1_TRAPU|nr:hypothetical protein TRAPUB_264 [Trametes pubescens]